MRSKWKYRPYNLLLEGGNKVFYETSKYDVPVAILNQRISVYNGKKLESLIVRDYMVGKRISGLVMHKYTGKNIHIKKKKRKK